MKHKTSCAILSGLLVYSCMSTNFTTYATTNSINNESTNNKYNFYPVTVNYILEGTEEKIKDSKLLDDSEDFCSDYSIKFSNNLMSGNLDIQESIRDYYFSHYEIGGKRIESIDSIIHTSEENNIINVVYSEEIPKDGYLRKGYRQGIGIDFEYMNDSIDKEGSLSTELYDDTWKLEMPRSFSENYVEENANLVNANDKTLYINVNTKPLSTKDENGLIKKYNYIDSVNINMSNGFDDYMDPLILTYNPKSQSQISKETELTLYGVNIEGKVETLDTKPFTENGASFNIKTNLNKFQFLFVALNEEPELSIPNTDNSNKDTNQNIEANVTTDKNNVDNSSNKDNSNNSMLKLTEEKLLIIILTCFAIGGISTFLLSLIISTRNKNLKEKE